MMELLHVIQKPDNDDDDSQVTTKKELGVCLHEHVLLLGNPLHAWKFFVLFCRLLTLKKNIFSKNSPGTLSEGHLQTVLIQIRTDILSIPDLGSNSLKRLSDNNIE